MKRDGWDYDDLDEDYEYEDNYGNHFAEYDCLVSERECKAVQKRQTKKEVSL